MSSQQEHDITRRDVLSVLAIGGAAGHHKSPIKSGSLFKWAGRSPNSRQSKAAGLDIQLAGHCK